MSVSNMRDKVSFLKLCIETDEYGEEIKTYRKFLTVSAETMYKGGREFERFNQLNSENDIIFKIRHVKNINPLMRLSFDGREMDITAAIPASRYKRFLLIHCKERSRAN